MIFVANWVKMNQKRLLPDIQDLYKGSTAGCAEIFDQLNSTINFIEAFKPQLNRIQRRLLERFVLGAIEFSHDMLLAEGYSQEIERRLAVSGHNQRLLYSDLVTCDQPSEETPLSLVTQTSIRTYDEALVILRRVQVSTLEGIKEGIEVITRGIVEEQATPNALVQEALEVLSAAVNDLEFDINTAFRTRFGIIEVIKNQYATKVSNAFADTNQVSEGINTQLTVEEFMRRVSPPPKVLPKATDHLVPFVPDIANLKAKGYSWQQISDFLEHNGISMYPGPLAGFFNKWQKRHSS